MELGVLRWIAPPGAAIAGLGLLANPLHKYQFLRPMSTDFEQAFRIGNRRSGAEITRVRAHRDTSKMGILRAAETAGFHLEVRQ